MNTTPVPDRIADLITEWTRLRADATAFEAREHPPLTDPLGRVWEWWSADIYRHCKMAVPADWVPLATDHLGEWARQNPAYRGSCALCWGPDGDAVATLDGEATA